jgi:hypothetical protein
MKVKISFKHEVILHFEGEFELPKGVTAKEFEQTLKTDKRVFDFGIDYKQEEGEGICIYGIKVEEIRK